jgi:hypothetical protein
MKYSPLMQSIQTGFPSLALPLFSITFSPQIEHLINEKMGAYSGTVIFMCLILNIFSVGCFNSFRDISANSFIILSCSFDVAFSLLAIILFHSSVASGYARTKARDELIESQCEEMQDE